MSSFENLRVVDNFYQTSLFFPMPTVIISTLCEDGTTTLGQKTAPPPWGLIPWCSLTMLQARIIMPCCYAAAIHQIQLRIF